MPSLAWTPSGRSPWESMARACCSWRSTASWPH